MISHQCRTNKQVHVLSKWAYDANEHQLEPLGIRSMDECASASAISALIWSECNDLEGVL